MNKEMLKKEMSFGHVMLWIVILVLLLITLFPFYWVVRTSFTPASLMYSDAVKMLPSKLTGMNYVRVLGMVSAEESLALGGSGQSVNFLVNVRNSFVIAFITTVCQVFFCAMAGYGFSRLRFPGRDKIFALILATMMVPGVVMMIPNFVFVRQLGLLNTYGGIVLPALFMTPYSVFFMRQFFMGINKEIEEAAYLDGAGQYRTFFMIIMPLMQTAVITLAVTVAINTWNDYMWPLIVGRKEELRTLTVALGVFRSQTPQGQPDWSGLMAGTVLAIIPAFIIYAFLGKKIINSIQFSGFR
ncbi:MAG: carbohydrate ABC transporter permease [Treponema sp.]|nr:carbohydrate ABC transporter permease [Treponema sp.]